MKKSELHNLRKYVGNLETLYGIRESMLMDGPDLTDAVGVNDIIDHYSQGLRVNARAILDKTTQGGVN